jgi:ketosteroid isomerase-like protein
MSRVDPADRSDLDDLVARYAAAVDRRDWAALGALFAEDAVLVTPDVTGSLEPLVESHGRDAVVATISAVAGFAATLHHLTGSVWEVSGSTAEGRTTAVAHHVEAGPEPRSWVWHVEYADRCTRSGAGWVFSRRTLTVRMIEARAPARVLPFTGPDGG